MQKQKISVVGLGFVGLTLAAVNAKKGFLSIVIPTFNSSNLLIRCLAALEKQSASKLEFEVVVVNDGSTDKTIDSLSQFQENTDLNLKWISILNSGPGNARNAGVEISSGSWIGFLDSDVIPHRNWVENSIKLIQGLKDTIQVTFNEPLVTYDSIKFKFDASKIKSQYGYSLDGNQDGTPGDDYIKQKIVYLPIDYDLDRKIDSKDISLFIDYFKSNQSGRETAPVSSGKVPYITIDPDGKYDIDDMLTFVQFGNWYLEGAQGKILDDITNTSISLDSTIRSSIYQIPLLQSMQSIELYVSYDPLELEPLLNTINAEVKLSHHDSDNGLISMILFNPDQEHIDIKWKHLKESSESDVSLLLKTEYNDQSVQVKRSMFKIMSVPDEYALHDNFPNPFNPTTTFKFDIPKEGKIRLNIYNILGQQVKTFHLSNLTPGYHSIIWDSTNDFGEQVGGGVYFYQLQSQDFMQTKKMILLK